MSTDITTTEKFPYKRDGIDNSVALTEVTFPAGVGTTPAGNVQLRLQEAKLPKGIYELTISGNITSTNIANHVNGRLSYDGGSTWENFSVKADIVGERSLFSQVIPLVDFKGETIDYVVQFKKQTGTDTVTLVYADLTMKRVA